MTKNYALAQRVIDWIAEDPDILDMHTFGRASSITPMKACFAGLAILLEGRGHWIEVCGDGYEFVLAGMGHDEVGYYGPVSADGVARMLLGLSNSDLFYQYRNTEILAGAQEAFDGKLYIPEWLQGALEERHRQQEERLVLEPVFPVVDEIAEALARLRPSAEEVSRIFDELAEQLYQMEEGEHGEVLHEAASRAG